jgi:hypothetical protein
MAIATVTGYNRSPMGNGKWLIWGTITGPASYTSGGEVLTRAFCSSIWGVSDIQGLAVSPAGDATHANGVICNFERTGSDATNVGEFHFFNAVPAHLHSFLVKGGTAAATTDVVNIKSLVIGKEEATDRTNLGGATNGGVQNATAAKDASEVAASTDLSTYTFFVWGIGG